MDVRFTFSDGALGANVIEIGSRRSDDDFESFCAEYAMPRGTMHTVGIVIRKW